MGFFKKFEEKMITGKIIKDYGVIQEKDYGIGKSSYNILLTEQENEQRIVIKCTGPHATARGYNAIYFIINIENAQKLRNILDDALKTPFSTPLEPH